MEFFFFRKSGNFANCDHIIASAFGTVFPQEMYIPPNLPAAEYYQDQYGWLGQAIL